MKPLIFLLCAMTALVARAQEPAAQQRDFHMMQVGLTGSADICYRFLRNSDVNPSFGSVKETRDNDEIPIIGYTFGVSTSYNFSRALGLELGVQYASRGYKTIDKDLTPLAPDPRVPLRSQFIYDYHYIDIPLKLNLFLGRKKVRFITSAGLAANIFIEEVQTSVQTYSDRTITKSAPTTFTYRSVVPSALVSAGVDWKVTPWMNLRMEPVYRCNVMSVIDAPLNGYLYSVGLNMGCYLGF